MPGEGSTHPEVPRKPKNLGAMRRNQKMPRSGEGGAQAGPRSRTLARLFFSENNSHPPPLQVGRLTQDAVSSREWGAATHAPSPL